MCKINIGYKFLLALMGAPQFFSSPLKCSFCQFQKPGLTPSTGLFEKPFSDFFGWSMIF
jgi:hypothetical protein